MLYYYLISLKQCTVVNIWSASKPFIKAALKPKTKMRSCVRTTLINFFDPLQKRYRDKGDVIWLDRKSALD